jgi:hypothetical protein
MRRLLTASFVALCSLAIGPGLRRAAGARPPIGRHLEDHAAGRSCSEVYRIRADGTMVVTSAEQISETTFEISAEPSARGFYKWDDTIVKDNGKKDCSGAVMEVGHKATNYIRFNPAQSMFVMCQEERMDTCIGPFIRQGGQGV